MMLHETIMPSDTPKETSNTGITLVSPHARYRETYLDGFRELTTDAERSAWIYLGDAAPLDTLDGDFDTYVDTLLKREFERPPGFVCDTIYWGLVGNVIVGRIALRHELNEMLATVGGHIGYIVRTSYRSKGMASAMLGMVLATERARALGKLLVTCDEGNAASEHVITRNGGVYEGSVSPGPGRPLKKRFWIDARER